MFKLKEFRLAHSMYQAQMAEILGQTQSGISRMETEKIELTIAQYQKLYDKFGKEEVDAYRIEPDSSLIPSSRKDSDIRTTAQQISDMLEIIRKQNETISSHIVKQDEFNARLLNLLERGFAQTNACQKRDISEPLNR